MRFVAIAFALVVAAALSAGPGIAQGTGINLTGEELDPNAPVEITATQLTVNRETGEATFEGDVLVIQGSVRLTADRIEVRYNEGSDGDPVESVRAIGNVVLVNGVDAAESTEAVFTPASNTVVMSGNVLLTQGAAAISGERLTVNLTSGAGQIEGNVRTVLQSADPQ